MNPPPDKTPQPGTSSSPHTRPSKILGPVPSTSNGVSNAKAISASDKPAIYLPRIVRPLNRQPTPSNSTIRLNGLSTKRSHPLPLANAGKARKVTENGHIIPRVPPKFSNQEAVLEVMATEECTKTPQIRSESRSLSNNASRRAVLPREYRQIPGKGSHLSSAVKNSTSSITRNGMTVQNASATPSFSLTSGLAQPTMRSANAAIPAQRSTPLVQANSAFQHPSLTATTSQPPNPSHESSSISKTDPPVPTLSQGSIRSDSIASHGFSRTELSIPLVNPRKRRPATVSSAEGASKRAKTTRTKDAAKSISRMETTVIDMTMIDSDDEMTIQNVDLVERVKTEPTSPGKSPAQSVDPKTHLPTDDSPHGSKPGHLSLKLRDNGRDVSLEMQVRDKYPTEPLSPDEIWQVACNETDAFWDTSPSSILHRQEYVGGEEWKRRLVNLRKTRKGGAESTTRHRSACDARLPFLVRNIRSGVKGIARTRFPYLKATHTNYRPTKSSFQQFWETWTFRESNIHTCRQDLFLMVKFGHFLQIDSGPTIQTSPDSAKIEIFCNNVESSIFSMNMSLDRNMAIRPSEFKIPVHYLTELNRHHQLGIPSDVELPGTRLRITAKFLSDGKPCLDPFESPWTVFTSRNGNVMPRPRGWFRLSNKAEQRLEMRPPPAWAFDPAQILPPLPQKLSQIPTNRIVLVCRDLTYTNKVNYGLTSKHLSGFSNEEEIATYLAVIHKGNFHVEVTRELLAGTPCVRIRLRDRKMINADTQISTPSMAAPTYFPVISTLVESVTPTQEVQINKQTNSLYVSTHNSPTFEIRVDNVSDEAPANQELYDQSKAGAAIMANDVDLLMTDLSPMNVNDSMGDSLCINDKDEQPPPVTSPTRRINPNWTLLRNGLTMVPPTSVDKRKNESISLGKPTSLPSSAVGTPVLVPTSNGLVGPIMSNRINKYTNWSTRIDPGTLADLFPELDKIWDGGTSRYLIRDHEESVTWTRYHLTEKQRFMACCWNRWVYQKGPIPTSHRSDYYISFIRAYGEVMIKAGLTREIGDTLHVYWRDNHISLKEMGDTLKVWNEISGFHMKLRKAREDAENPNRLDVSVKIEK
ncbi:uncharacterized protein I206_104659 [Kwoniella pini CBS 10737]|uniref:Uncharacterized protein n=1 Tax=Kwoniella pini CBS 10737 TaxID=1296096 RepID=A0A1B9I7I6_9TREE|nr:uncharacterized protein I206_02197 [Kwoniella pini CBS 10737]OCF51483.1 hypothetical protein I206_02197 [Kwoniella pini CBS 10737]